MSNMYTIVIEADYNDGDYLTNIEDISTETLNNIKPIIEAIKNCESSHNWPTGEYCDSDPTNLYEEFVETASWDEFNDLVPHGEYGVHTIVSIKVYPKIDKTQLL